MQIEGTITIGVLITASISVVALVWGGAWALVSIVAKQFSGRVDEKFTALSRQVEDNQEQTKEAIRSLRSQIASDRSATDAKLEALQAQVRTLERDLLNLKSELPNHYERRDDAIRREVTITSRLESIAAMIRDGRARE